MAIVGKYYLRQQGDKSASGVYGSIPEGFCFLEGPKLTILISEAEAPKCVLILSTINVQGQQQQRALGVRKVTEEVATYSLL